MNIPDVTLINILHRHFAQLRENVKLKWAEPASGLTITLQLSITCFKSLQSHDFKRVIGSRKLARFAFPFLDWVAS